MTEQTKQYSFHHQFIATGHDKKVKDPGQVGQKKMASVSPRLDSTESHIRASHNDAGTCATFESLMMPALDPDKNVTRACMSAIASGQHEVDISIPTNNFGETSFSARIPYPPQMQSESMHYPMCDFF
jgi:hypothetical protein